MLLVLTTSTVFSIATIMLEGGMAMINDLCQDINIMSGRVLYVTEQLLFHTLFLAPLTLVDPVDPCQHTQLVHNIVIDNLLVRAARRFMYCAPRTGLKQCTHVLVWWAGINSMWHRLV